MREVQKPELELLLACARAHPSDSDVTVLRQILTGQVDWTLFARKTVAHGLAGLAGHTLGRAAPDLVPPEILSAFQEYIEQTRDNNLVLLNELVKLLDLLNGAGVKVVPFKGPVLAYEAYGDLGLREFRDLDFLIEDCSVAPAIEVFQSFGYQRQFGGLTELQFDLIHRLQGQEILFKQGASAIEPHTRFTSLKMALD